MFGSYFGSVFRPDDHRPPPIVILDFLMPELEIANSIVSALLEPLPVHKLARADSMHTQLLKTMALIRTGFMTSLFNKIQVNGVTPSDWQTTLATPTHKKGSV